MAFGKTFDKSKPAGSEAAKTADNYFRDDKTALNERYRLEHYGLDTSEGDASATDTAANAQGRHRPGGCSVAYVGDYSTFPASPPNGALAWAEDRQEFYVGVGGAWVAKQAGRPTTYFAEGTSTDWAGSLSTWEDVANFPTITIPNTTSILHFDASVIAEFTGLTSNPFELAIGIAAPSSTLRSTARFARSRTGLVLEKESLSCFYASSTPGVTGPATYKLMAYRTISWLFDFTYYLRVTVWP